MNMQQDTRDREREGREKVEREMNMQQDTPDREREGREKVEREMNMQQDTPTERLLTFISMATISMAPTPLQQE